MAREPIIRKGTITMSPEDGHWTLNDEHLHIRANADSVVLLSIKERPQKVGVFVDYEEGLVSFYCGGQVS